LLNGDDKGSSTSFSPEILVEVMYIPNVIILFDAVNYVIK
jgi:hypothetical protein